MVLIQVKASITTQCSLEAFKMCLHLEVSIGTLARIALSMGNYNLVLLLTTLLTSKCISLS